MSYIAGDNWFPKKLILLFVGLGFISIQNHAVDGADIIPTLSIFSVREEFHIGDGKCCKINLFLFEGDILKIK